MVAQSPTSTEPAENRNAGAPEAPIRARSNLQRLLRTVSRLVEIQYRLILLRTRLTAQKIALYVGLVAAAVAAGLVGIIFLLIGLFGALTIALEPLVGPAWASTLSFIIFAAAFLAGALWLWVMARRIFAPEAGEPKPSANPPLTNRTADPAQVPPAGMHA